MIKLYPAKTPITFVETLEGGTAHVILFSDGKKYVVKWIGSRKQRAKEIVNEYVAGLLAQALFLPVVPFELVEIPEDFIKNTPQLHSKKINFSPGCQYACLFIENSMTLEKAFKNPPSRDEIVNHDLLAGMAVFDQWIYNFDRTLSNILLERHQQGGYYVHMIDHGLCFPGGYRWSQDTLTKKSTEETNYQDTYRWVFSIVAEEEMTAFIEKIINLPNKWIYNIIKTIPADWGLSREERDALYQFLVDRKNQLPTIIANFIAQYRGNDIAKKKKKKK